MSDYVMKCNKCGHKVETGGQLHQEQQEGKWFVSTDGLDWELEHKCWMEGNK